MLPLRGCVRGETDGAGAKALRLAEALRRGLPVPDGLVVLPVEPLPEADELSRALAALAGTLPRPSGGSAPALVSAVSMPMPVDEGGGEDGGAARFAVRSSAAVEDQPGRSAAGLFVSRLGVAPADVAAAIAEVRASGDSEAVRRYTGGAVQVAVLVQPMVAADRLGVLLLEPSGAATCEERTTGTPEWGDVTVRTLPSTDQGPLARGARALAMLLAEEQGPQVPALIEYALGPGEVVTFLQVRPAPPPDADIEPAWRAAVPEPLRALELAFDRDHNPDPLSAAQAGLVEALAAPDGGEPPVLVQAVVRGYLFYAPTPARPSGGSLAALPDRFRDEIAPAWEAALRPLEGRLVAADGALRPELQRPPGADPQQATELLARLAPELASWLPLPEALGAYRAVFVRYVGELQPALRRARAHLDQLLRTNLGEPLALHGALLGGLGGVQAEPLQALWQLGNEPGPERQAALRRYLARHGAWAPAWDVACACDDELPDRVLQQAARLAEEPRSPALRHEAAQEPFHAAVQVLLGRLPRMARGALKSLLPQVRAALLIAEEDDALFSRAQRLVRWALLLRGVELVRHGRLRTADQVFHLPLVLHEPDRARPFSAAALAPGVDLLELVARGAAAREAARALWPPSRIVHGRPHFELSAAGDTVLRGFGVPGGGPVRGRARILRGLDEAEALLAHPSDVADDEILVLPALLPAWAPALFRARALVTDSGGALGHGALLAREAGVPAVLGTRVATRRITPGQALLVDGEAGRVCLL